MRVSGNWEGDISNPRLMICIEFKTADKFSFDANDVAAFQLDLCERAFKVPQAQRDWKWLCDPRRRFEGGLSEDVPIEGDRVAGPVVVSFPEANERIVSSLIPSSVKRRKSYASTLKDGCTISAKVKSSPTYSASSPPKTSTRSFKRLKGQGSSSALTL